MRRRELREHIFKLLFMIQFNSQEEMPEQVGLYFEGLTDLAEKDQEYMQAKYAHIMEKLEEIDAILNEYSSGWKTSRMNRVDLSVLRLAVYEMKFEESDDVPVGVAINEAVELAKNFGGETSGSFVNGVLAKIASGRKEADEPKKPARQKHKAKIILKSKNTKKADAPAAKKHEMAEAMEDKKDEA